jgi:hypothetical protein
LHVSVQENVCTFHVSMQYLAIVESFEASNDLYENVPDLLLLNVRFLLLIVANLLEHIPVVCILHDEAIGRK